MTTILIVVAASAVILLVVLELMREVVVLRGEVSDLTRRLGTSASVGMGLGVELDLPLTTSSDWLLISLVSSDCPACRDLAHVVSEFLVSAPDLAQHLVFVDRDSSPEPADDVLPETGGSSGRGPNWIVAPDLFRILGVTTTPTMILVERHDDVWIVTDVAVGADTEWINSQLVRQATRPEGHVLESVVLGRTAGKGGL